MRPLVGKMPEGVDQPLAERLAQAIEHLAKTPAIGAEIVAVDHHSDPPATGAAATDVIAPPIDRALQAVRRGFCTHLGHMKSAVRLNA